MKQYAELLIVEHPYLGSDLKALKAKLTASGDQESHEGVLAKAKMIASEDSIIFSGRVCL
jgi:hypothetical protein